jgi:hypothetical protein
MTTAGSAPRCRIPKADITKRRVYDEKGQLTSRQLGGVVPNARGLHVQRGRAGDYARNAIAT